MTSPLYIVARTVLLDALDCLDVEAHVRGLPRRIELSPPSVLFQWRNTTKNVILWS
jgi:hypothetical protein